MAFEIGHSSYEDLWAVATRNTLAAPSAFSIEEIHQPGLTVRSNLSFATTPMVALLQRSRAINQLDAAPGSGLCWPCPWSPHCDARVWAGPPGTAGHGMWSITLHYTTLHYITYETVTYVYFFFIRFDICLYTFIHPLKMVRTDERETVSPSLAWFQSQARSMRIMRSSLLFLAVGSRNSLCYTARLRVVMENLSVLGWYCFPDNELQMIPWSFGAYHTGMIPPPQPWHLSPRSHGYVCDFLSWSQAHRKAKASLSFDPHVVHVGWNEALHNLAQAFTVNIYGTKAALWIHDMTTLAPRIGRSLATVAGYWRWPLLDEYETSECVQSQGLSCCIVLQKATAWRLFRFLMSISAGSAVHFQKYL